MQLTETQELQIKLAATEKTLAELKTVVAERIAANLNQEWKRENTHLRGEVARLKELLNAAEHGWVRYG